MRNHKPLSKPCILHGPIALHVVRWECHLSQENPIRWCDWLMVFRLSIGERL